MPLEATGRRPSPSNRPVLRPTPPAAAGQAPGRDNRKGRPRPAQKPQCLASGRLPHGARFVVDYDAGKECWSGTLTVDGQVYTDSASGVFKLLQRLDRQFRESPPATVQAPVPEPAGQA